MVSEIHRVWQGDGPSVCEQKNSDSLSNVSVWNISVGFEVDFCIFLYCLIPLLIPGMSVAHSKMVIAYWNFSQRTCDEDDENHIFFLLT